MSSIADTLAISVQIPARYPSVNNLGRDVLDEWWQKCLDGGEIQDLGVKHGFIEAYEAPADNDCACDESEPHICYRFAPIIRGTKDAAGGEHG